MHRLLVAFLAAIAFAGSALAADMPARMPVKAPIIVPPYNWTGFYVGLNIGGSWGKQDNNLVTTSGGTVLSNSANLDGVIGGGQIGYNWQLDQLVFGFEADFQGSGQKGDGDPIYTLPVGAVCGPFAVGCFGVGTPGATISYTDKLDWFGTVRARVGWAFDRWLPYVTGGWAYGHGEISGTTVTTTPTTTAFSASQNYSGWTVGGGLEWAFMNNWSAKVEYLYIDFGDGPTVAVSPSLNIVGGRMTDNIVRAGVNYKF